MAHKVAVVAMVQQPDWCPLAGQACDPVHVGMPGGDASRGFWVRADDPLLTEFVGRPGSIWADGEIDFDDLCRRATAKLAEMDAEYERRNAPHRGEAAAIDAMMQAAD